MKKEIPAQSDSITFPTRVDRLFKTIYTEKPEYWPFGLYRDQFNGIGDQVILLQDKDRDIGFIGLQKFRQDKQKNLGNVVSIALLPEYRGKGLSKRMLLEVLPTILKPDDGNIIWSVNRNNKASIGLANALAKEKDKIKNQICLQYT